MYRLTAEYFFLMIIGVEMCEFGWLFTSCLPLHETLGFLQNVCHTSFGRRVVFFCFFSETPTGAKFVI
jgi:hypothetical protein